MEDEFTDKLDTLTTELVTVLNSFAAIVRKVSGLSLSDYRMLGLLTTSPEGMRASKMAKALNLAPSSVSASVDRMRAMGLISVDPDSKDRRSTTSKITDAGTELVYKVDVQVRNFVESLWANISYEQRKLTVWGSIMAVSGRGMARVRNGEIDAHAAYLESVCISIWAYRHAARKHGLTLNEFRVLRSLADAEGGLRSSDLGVNLLLSSSEVAQLADALEKRDLVHRTESVVDLRVRLVSLTEKGSKLLQETIPDMLQAGKSDVTPISRHDVREYERIAERVIDYERSRFRYV